MLLAVFADIHANRQAFAACLDYARARGAERMICLGDYVGYGADPEWTVETVMGLVENGALAVRGNHDNAVGTPSESMNAEAQAAMEWTRGRLSAAQRHFLAELPFEVWDDDRLYVHSEASNPPKWRYVQNATDAARSIIATEVHVTFCGHIHRPALYSMSATAKMTSFVPTADVPVQLSGGRQWLAVVGSVGQPRDGDPAAAFALFDTERQQITYCRVPYDVEAAATRIRENGLPHWLADRLAGREVADGQAFGSARRRHRRLHHRGVRPQRRHGDAVERDAARYRRTAVDEDPEGIRRRGSRRHRQFRDGADDPAAAVGAARAGLLCRRRFHAAGLCRDRGHPGHHALQPPWRTAAALRRGQRHRRKNRNRACRPAPAERHPSRYQAEQHHVSPLAAKPC